MLSDIMINEGWLIVLNNLHLMYVKHTSHILNFTKNLLCLNISYRLGTVNSKSFVSKVLLRIKQKFQLIYAL